MNPEIFQTSPPGGGLPQRLLVLQHDCQFEFGGRNLSGNVNPDLALVVEGLGLDDQRLPARRRFAHDEEHRAGDRRPLLRTH